MLSCLSSVMPNSVSGNVSVVLTTLKEQQSKASMMMPEQCVTMHSDNAEVSVRNDSCKWSNELRFGRRRIRYAW